MQTSSIEDRVNRLERQNRMLRYMVLALIVIGGVGLLSSVRPVRAKAPAWKRTVEAEKFVLRDAGGKMRGAFTATVGGVALNLYDADGVLRATLQTSTAQTSLFLYDAGSLPLAGLGGKTGAPGLKFYDANGIKRVAFGVASDETGLVFADNTGRLRAVLDDSVEGPSLTLRDARGFKSVIGHVALQTPATGEQSQSSAASIHMFNSKGNVIWAAP